ncbi:formyltransferase family protein [Acinetobacter sp.]|uniref:formyltransferase family protein n=1 Tax=Acinetobacter sp. TaxID=472 RepID=UPI002FD8A057
MIAIAGKNNIAIYALEIFTKYYGHSEIIAIPNKTDNGIDSWQKSFVKRALELNVELSPLGNVDPRDLDVLISLEYDSIIKNEFLDIDKIYNIHFSNLPKYKGMYTSIFPILFNENCGGVTLHRVDSGIDTGNILDQTIFNIKKTDRSQDLYAKYIRESQKLLSHNFNNIINNNFNEIVQKKEESSYFSKDSIDFINLKINLNATAWEVQRQIYAYSFRVYQLPKVFNKKIVEVDILDEKSNKKYGTILRESDFYFDIATIDYDIRLYFDNIDRNLENIKFCKKNEIENLIKGMCGVHDRNGKGISPILIATLSGRISHIEKLLEMNANINDIDYCGRSVLMYAAYLCDKTKNYDVLKFVLDQGAEISHQDFYGKSVIEYLGKNNMKYLGI